MKTLFTAEAISKGGRSGTIKTPDGMPVVTLGNPLERSGEKRGENVWDCGHGVHGAGVGKPH
jgi:hypothetical protein